MAGGHSHDSGDFLSDINVTPLVDVMLVLLIIFMITAPFLKEGVEVNLPTATTSAQQDEGRILITLNRDGDLFLRGRAVSLAELTRQLEAIPRGEPLFLEADQAVPYGRVVEVMDQARELGHTELALITRRDAAAPARERPRRPR